MSIALQLESVGRMKEWMTHTRVELALRDRIRRIQEVVAKPKVTTADLLVADFGTARPAGLDITALPTRPVKIRDTGPGSHFSKKSPHEQKEWLENIAASAYGDGAIEMHPELADFMRQPYRLDRATLVPAAFKVSTIGHEGVHQLQGAQIDMHMRSGLASANARLLRTAAMEGGGIIARLTNFFVEKAQQKVEARYAKELGSSLPDYYLQEKEMQARLHEMIAPGYAQWQKMPVTKTELWAALSNMGVNTPPSVRWELMTSAEGLKALVDFRCSAVLKESVQSRVKILNALQEYAVLPGRRKHLWDKTMPMLYGHLLELYGDGPGRARMGMGVNPRAAMAVMKALHDGVPDAAERAALVAAVPPENASELVNAIVNMGGRTLTAPQEAMLAAILAVPELRDAVVDNRIHDVITAGADMPALENAVERGNARAVNMLLNAGCDPARRTGYRLLDGTENEMGPLSGMGHQYAQMCAKLDAAAKHGPQSLVYSFNEHASLAEVRQRVKDMESGMTAVAGFYNDKKMPVPDSLRPFVEAVQERKAQEQARTARVWQPGAAV